MFSYPENQEQKGMRSIMSERKIACLRKSHLGDFDGQTNKIKNPIARVKKPTPSTIPVSER